MGAQALNDIVPKALALLPEAERPVVVHQSGAKQIEALQKNYANAEVKAELTPFIEDTAQAFADADLIGCPLRLTVGRKGLERGVIEGRESNGTEHEFQLDDAASQAAAARRAIP